MKTIPTIKMSAFRDLNAEEIRLITKIGRRQTISVEKRMRTATNLLKTLSQCLVANGGSASVLDPMKAKVATKRTDRSAHALMELYKVPFFASKRKGEIITENLPEIQFTKKTFQMVHHPPVDVS